MRRGGGREERVGEGGRRGGERVRRGGEGGRRGERERDHFVRFGSD